MFSEKLRLEFPTFLEGDAWLLLLNGPYALLLALVLLVALVLVCGNLSRYRNTCFVLGIAGILGSCAALNHADVSAEWLVRHEQFAKEAIAELRDPEMQRIQSRRDVIVLHSALRERYMTHTHLLELMHSVKQEASAPDVTDIIDYEELSREQSYRK